MNIGSMPVLLVSLYCRLCFTSDFIFNCEVLQWVIMRKRSWDFPHRAKYLQHNREKTFSNLYFQLYNMIHYSNINRIGKDAVILTEQDNIQKYSQIRTIYSQNRTIYCNTHRTGQYTVILTEQDNIHKYSQNRINHNTRRSG